MEDKINGIIKESSSLVGGLDLADEIAEAVGIIVGAYKSNGKVLLFGNGGSAADAQHISAELVGRFKKDRAPLAAICLNADTAVLTALANDYGYENVFSRQVEALVRPGDVAIGISTSGKSKNVLNGIKAAKSAGAKTICLCGKNAMAADLSICVNSEDVPRVQEAHAVIGHIICGLIEEEIFGL